jgi:hypothetical protein
LKKEKTGERNNKKKTWAKNFVRDSGRKKKDVEENVGK